MTDVAGRAGGIRAIRGPLVLRFHHRYSGQAWKPAPTGLRWQFGMPYQRQMLRVWADRRVRPHR